MIYFFRRIIRDYLSHYRKQVFLLLCCIFILIAFDTIFPLGTTFLIDQAIVPHDGGVFLKVILLLVGLFVISSFSSLGLDYLTAWLQAHVTNELRLQMFAHLHSLPASFYTRLQSGDVITRFNTDLNAIEYSLAYSVVEGIKSVIELVFSVVILFQLDAGLGAVTLVLLPITVAFPKRLVDRATELLGERRIQESIITSTVQENLQANPVNRVFNLRSLAVAAFTSQLNRFARIVTRSNYYDWLVYRATGIGQYLIQLIVMGIGGYLVFIDRMSLGSWVGFSALLVNVSYAVTMVASAWAGLIPAVTSYKRIDSFMGEKILITDHPEVALGRFEKEIALETVTFSYPGNSQKPNLDQVTLHIPSGQSVAIIGRSGSGKSTILNLLMRFYDPQAGAVLLDGQDIQQVSLASLRQQMGVVFQDSFLFNISLRENIRLGKEGASDAEVEEAAKAAGIHDAIIRLPAGYDTLAGEQGKGLSGGQRQRICLARAIIRRPPILLLDEATSALDPESESLIYKTLGGLKHTCTIISVTHRLSPIVDCDQIIVMDQGKVAEVGIHQDLMKQEGIYFQLFSQQNGFTISPDGLYAEVTPDRLRRIPLFSQIDSGSLELLTTQFLTERFEAGQVILRQGDAGDKFYVVVRGKLAVTARDLEEQVRSLPTMQDGDYFGEIALLEGGKRTTTVQAILPSMCLSLDRRHFLQMLARNPEMRQAVEATAHQRMEQSKSENSD